MEKEIIEYDDYRDFLKARFTFLKGKRKNFSFAYCAKKLGSGTGYLKEIFSKKKKMGFDRISPIAELFRLTVFEREYFTIQVIRELTKSAKLRQYFGDVLDRMKYEHRSRLMAMVGGASPEKSFVLGNWLYATLLELTCFPHFSPEPDWIKSVLIDGDRLETKDIQAALDSLINAGIIVQRKDGKWRAENIYVPGGPYSSDQFKLYKAGLEKAADSLERPGQYKADGYFTATFVANSEVEARLIEMCRNFRIEVINTIKEVKNPEKVLLMNLNYLNLVKPNR
jgi:uncharacterized protein (TIGR02147 family)